jgi:transposase-like protein
MNDPILEGIPPELLGDASSPIEASLPTITCPRCLGTHVETFTNRRRYCKTCTHTWRVRQDGSLDVPPDRPKWRR